MEYSYDPFREDEPDIYPVSLERQICLVYDNDDIVTETIIDFINSDMQQSYEIVPMATLALTPRTESLFKVTDDYPERFFKWADKFIYIINSYTGDCNKPTDQGDNLRGISRGCPCCIRGRGKEDLFSGNEGG